VATMLALRFHAFMMACRSLSTFLLLSMCFYAPPVAISPTDDEYHAKAWNDKHPGHEFGIEHSHGHGKKH
jgi:hypothetical protein